MSAWPGKYVIGLTGNIATGKSVIRKMLEHLGAYGIDADALSHRAIAKEAPGFQSVVDTFGTWVLGADGQIDRAKLGRLVFSDAEALATLESIVHPLVRQAVDILVRRSRQKIIVIEAIKLLESPLRQACDALWVSYAPPEVQLMRLVKKRGMSIDAARQRVRAQASQEEKVAAANVVIRNDGTFENAWSQVSAAWQSQFALEGDTEPIVTARQGEMMVEKARPRQAGEIAHFVNRISGGHLNMDVENIMEAFGEKAFIFLKVDRKPVGLVGWQVENLVARTDDVYLEASLPLKDAMKAILEEVETASRDLQCEVSLLFLPAHLARHDAVWRELGYEPRSVQSLGVRAWQEAAQDTISRGEVMLFKQLRKDRVLKPV